MFRIGHGYDLHRLVAGRNLIIGGINIPYHLGALGHSDADVLIHALIDAILGAAAAGNIGSRFPDSDPQYADVSSTILLTQVYQHTILRSYSINNIDATILLESPKLQPYIAQICNNIAKILHLNISQISIKAKTHEGLGDIGTNKAIAAHAVVLLQEHT
jgi:2-C-methyl-D-erythritol 2,4-cyclodiphosphate synthase